MNIHVFLYTDYKRPFFRIKNEPIKRVDVFLFNQVGKVSKEAFVEVIVGEGFQNLVQSEEIKKLIMTHEKAKDEIDYKLFLTGKKYINKLFLVSSFDKKKKKKKKPKAKKAKKTKVIMPICVLDEGPRMVSWIHSHLSESSILEALLNLKNNQGI